MSADSVQNKKNALHSADQPPVTEYFLKRPVIDQILQNAFRKPLATVIAGAGYGKTQAVLSALRGMDCSSVWLQLSELDNHAARFWERIADAFGSWNRNLRDSLISIGYPESNADFHRFLTLLVKELKPSGRFILVLDDFYLIRNGSILNFIDLFISARVKNVSVVLISRTKPDISLMGMLSKGLLARVTEDELRFSADEMNAYLRMQNPGLSESVSADIYSYTNGWIFAIHLVSLAVRKGNMQNPVFPAKIDIFDLIEKEIFAASSKELQNLLIRISILDGIPSGLLKVLASNNDSLIYEMLQLSMFISCDALSDSYRIHHLFREFLLEKKVRPGKYDLSGTHLAAAEWHIGNNNKFEAIYHYKQINRYREIFDIIISIPGRIPSEAADSLIKLIEQATDDTLGETPVIRVAKAGYMFNNNRLEEARLELSELLEEFESQPQTEKTRAVLGEVYLLLAVIGMVYSDYAFEELFRKADSYLPGGSKLVDYQTGMAEGVNACSIRNPAAGELQRYQDALFRAAPYAVRAMNGSCCGLEYLNAAESGLYMGDLQSAEKYAYEAIYRSKQYVQRDIEYMANFVLVRIFSAKGSYEKAAGILDQMKKQTETPQYAGCICLSDIICGWFYTKLGMTDRVAEWIRYEDETRKMFAPVVIGREYLVRSDCLIAEERYAELLALMGQTDQLYENRGILFAVIQNKITRAIIHHYMGHHAESIQSFNEAYELSYPNNLIMQFIEYGNKMRTLIHSAKLNKNCTIPQNWLNKIYTKSSSYAKMLAQLASAYDAAHNKTDNRNPISLSKRESEILECLYRGMTRKEIAADCYISLSTVNSILKNIYNKLGAANAANAVRIAKEKNFI